MRIVLMGQAAFGEKVFEALLGSGEEVVGVYAPPDASPGKTNTLVALAEANGTPTRQPQKMRAGASAINWAVINGETNTGLSIFWPDEGLDTGPILLQEEVDIGPDETMGQVYFNKLFPLGVQSMLEAVRLVKDGDAPRVRQDLSQGEYEPVCKAMNIDWAYPVSIVYNVIRGCNPSPGAATVYKGQPLRIFDCEKQPDSGRQAPGTILQVTPQGFLVAANGGSLLIKRVQTDGSAKLGIEEFGSTYGLRVGDRLGA
jgi:methionyl-tRNA formyltransferase